MLFNLREGQITVDLDISKIYDTGYTKTLPNGIPAVIDEAGFTDNKEDTVYLHQPRHPFARAVLSDPE